jgi:type IV pilus assembly protein PilM
MSLPRVLAVDCGAGHAACGLFSSDKSGRLKLEKLSFGTFNPDAAVEADWALNMAQAIGDSAKAEKLSGDVVIGLPGHHILGKFIKIPTIEESKRQKIVQFEAQQNIPYALDEVVWDYQVVADQGLDLELMLAAAKKEVVQGACDAVTRSGLGVDSLVPSSVAVTRCFRYNYPESTGSVIIADIGARSTNLIFVDAERFFVRTIPLAGNGITQSVAEEIKHDFARCEAIKLQVLGGTSELPANSPARAAVQNAVNSFIGRLHLELTRSIVNYRRQSGAEQPVALYLTGGCSMVPELAEKLGEKLKMQVERLNPLKNVADASGSGAEFEAVLASLVGLAVPPEAGKKSINLLPPDISEKRAFARRQPMLMAAALLVALSLTPLVVQNSRALDAARKDMRALENAIQPLDSLQNRIRENARALEEVKAEVLAVQSLAESKNNWINFFSDLQDRLVKVEDVWLEALSVIRPTTATAPAAAGGLFGGAPQNDAVVEEGAGEAKPVIRLQLSGRLLDRKNPVSRVSSDSYERVKALLASFVDSEFISAVESERFDPTTPGILRFDFILVIDPARPL